MTTSLTTPPTNEGLDRLMGFVVALRFLIWGGAFAGVAAALFIEALRYPNLLRLASIPLLLAIYLAGTGQVLLLIRLNSLRLKLLALGPLLSLLLFVIPAIRESTRLAALALAAGFWLFLVALAEQTIDLEHDRAAKVFRRLYQFLAPLTAVIAILPGAASPIVLFLGPILLGAMLIGWRIWLTDLRITIEERKNLG